MGLSCSQPLFQQLNRLLTGKAIRKFGDHRAGVRFSDLRLSLCTRNEPGGVNTRHSVQALT